MFILRKGHGSPTRQLARMAESVSLGFEFVSFRLLHQWCCYLMLSAVIGVLGCGVGGSCSTLSFQEDLCSWFSMVLTPSSGRLGACHLVLVMRAGGERCITSPGSASGLGQAVSLGDRGWLICMRVFVAVLFVTIQKHQRSQFLPWETDQQTLVGPHIESYAAIKRNK